LLVALTRGVLTHSRGMIRGCMPLWLLLATLLLGLVCKGDRVAYDEEDLSALHTKGLNGEANFPPGCVQALTDLQAELEAAAWSSEVGRNWKMVATGQADKSAYHSLWTGQTDLFSNWTGEHWNDRYKGDQDSFGGRPRWFSLNNFNVAARYGGNSHHSLGCRPGYEQRRYPKGFFWDLVSPRVINYGWNATAASALKLLDGRDQAKYWKVLKDQCKITLTGRGNNRHSIDRFKETRKIVAAFLEAGIDGILESDSVDGWFRQIVLFRPEKHLKWIFTVAGQLDCEDSEGLHYRYSATDAWKKDGDGDKVPVANYECDGRDGNFRSYFGRKRKFDGTVTPIVPAWNN